MKKVLFIGMTPNQGGLETFMINIFSKLENNGYKFDFVNVYNKPIAYSHFIELHGGTIHKVKLNNSHIGFFTRYYSAKRFFKAHHDYDIVHLNTLSLNNLYWLKAAYKYNINKLIIHSHDCNLIHKSLFVELFSKLLSTVNRSYLHRHRIIQLAVSKNAGDWMFHDDNFHIINNGINTKEYLFNRHKRDILRYRYNISKRSNVFITVARLTSQKNYPKIISIFYFIHKMSPASRLFIIGDGPKWYEIKLLINKYKLNKSVFMLGNINDVNNVLNIADLMIMPSKYEGFPFALVESQASGVPAIVSLNAVPKSANITNTLKYVSLNKSSLFWAKESLNMVIRIKNNISYRYYMNKLVRISSYDIASLIKQIKYIYN